MCRNRDALQVKGQGILIVIVICAAQRKRFLGPGTYLILDGAFQKGLPIFGQEEGAATALPAMELRSKNSVFVAQGIFLDVISDTESLTVP